MFFFTFTFEMRNKFFLIIIKGISFLKEEGNDFEFINAINKEWSGALPFTIIYDKNGNTFSYWENMQDKEFFETKIREALAS